MNLKESEERIKQKELIREWLEEEATKSYDKENYVKPEFKPLTKEQIDDIHKRGRITPQEMVEEWEGFDLCAPGNSGFNDRCNSFADCHDCLVDYSNHQDEYVSHFTIMNVVSAGVFEDELNDNQEWDVKKKALKK